MENIDKKSLGATYNDSTKSVEFRIFSHNAENVVLEIFENKEDAEALASFNLEKNGDVWETSIKKYALFNLKKPFYYGYRVFGKNEFFNSDILAYDPYSRVLEYDNKKENYQIKSGYTDYTPFKIAQVPTRPFEEEIIAEVHLKDLIIKSKPENISMFKVAGDFAPILKKYNITMIEFLPLNDFDNNGNYWGYMPLSYFALQKNYGSNKNYEDTLLEFQDMIDKFHQNGIKVCMDVVYNHSAENASFKLIDADSYYKINKDGYFMNNSGCGNDLKASNKYFQNLVADSIAYFVNLGIDAFRFDLGLALMDISIDEENIYNNETSLLANLPKLLEERGIKVSDGKTEGINLITEPWTCGGKNPYALGKFPDFVYEWNDIARNTIRSSTLRPDNLTFLDYKNLIEGTPQIFQDKIRSINYITSHDGFTLNDLNSYYKDGWEICGDHFGDKNRKNNSIKKQIMLLLLSKGATMLQLGDLIMHTKCGENNTYKDDNEINYLDFSSLDTDKETKEIFDFWQKMIIFRLKYKPQNFYKTYFNQFGEKIIDYKNAKNNFFGMLIKSDKEIFIVSNNTKEDLEYNFPNNDNWTEFLRSSTGTNKILKPYEIAIYIK